MSRERYHDFRQEDSTELFNNRFRAMLQAGVYAGFNVSLGGSGGLWLKFTHDPDPDNTGEVLGKLTMPDGVQIEENEDQDDVAQGSLTNGTPNIHYVVASYTYNKALPNNDVVYAVKQGTAGTPPTPPPLTDDEIVLCEIDIPSGATGYDSPGVTFRNVAKKNLYGITDPELFVKFDGVLKAGIYGGMTMVQGSTTLDVTLEAGTWITQELVKIVESADQADLVTLTNPGVGQYKWAWLVGMHKRDETDPPPSVDYLLVEGTPAAVGSQATPPSNSTILTAAQAVDSKYTNAAYINKLGLIRLENRGGTYYIDYIRGETILQRDSIIVHGGTPDSMSRSGMYYGHPGLVQAIEDVYAIQKDKYELNRPYTIYLDGEFKTDDVSIELPSNVRLRGLAGPARILSDNNVPVKSRGKEFSWDTVNATVSVAAGTSSPPSGFVAKEWTVQAAYQSGDTLEALKFSAGDPVWVSSNTNGIYAAGMVVSVISPWVVEVWVPTQYQTDGDPTDLSISFVKRNVELEDVTIDGLGTGVGMLDLRQIVRSRLHNVRTNRLYVSGLGQAHWGFVEIVNQISLWNDYFTVTPSDLGGGKYNSFDHIRIYDEAATAQYTLGQGGWDTRIGTLEYLNPSNAIDFRPAWPGLKCDKLIVQGSSGCNVGLYSSDLSFQAIHTTGRVQTGNGHRIFVAYCKADEVDIQANGQDIVFVYVSAPTISNTASDPKNKILSVDQDSQMNEHFLEQANEDRNLKLCSIANITWASGNLEWDAEILIDIPWNTGYVSIAAGSKSLSSDGDRLYADIDREATTTVAGSVAVRAKASATADRFAKNRIFLAVRNQNVIYLFDGTRIEDGQTVTIGSTPPPDGSVTYEKLGADALEFHKLFFRDYVALDDESTDWPNEVVLRNTGLLTMTYTASTGVIQYSGSVDLSSVVPGDLIVLINNFEHVTNAWNREEILSVNDGANQVTIRKGLSSLVTGAANVWNGAIVRGAKMLDNYTLSTMSYDSSTGRVTFTPSLGFSQYQVLAGYVFVDSEGKRHPIIDRDTTGTGAWVSVGHDRRDVSVGTPTESWQGSIEVNNNPDRINLADLRTLHGIEFIPIDWYGKKSPVGDELLSAMTNGGSDYSVQEAHQRLFPEPYDHRVRVWLRGQARDGERQFGGDDPGAVPNVNSIQTASQQFVSVEFTGPCTGIALVMEHLGGTTGDSTSVVYDGYRLNGNDISWNGSEDVDNTYSPVRHFHANLVYHPALIRVPFGIHNFRFDVSNVFSGGGINPACIRGILVFNNVGSGDNTVVDAPGVLVRKGGVTRFSSPTRASLPTSTESYDKGGRIVRYVDTDNTRKWTNQWIRGFTDTGNVANGSGDITSVASPTQWRLGDLMLIINGSARTIHAVTAISGSTVTVTPSVNFTAAGHTLRYYGHVPYDTDSHYDRYQEDVAAQFNFAEFTCGGPANNHRGPAVYAFDTTRSGPIGVRLSDLATTLEGSTGFKNESIDNNSGLTPFDALEFPNSGTLRIRFIGTGLAVMLMNSTDIQLRVDGMTVNAATLGSYFTRKNNSIGGTYLVGELPYGHHFVDLVDTSGAANARIQQVTIFQPKKPVLPADAFELLDTNLLSPSGADLGLNPVGGVAQMQIGTINMDAGAVVGMDVGDALADTPRSFGSAIGAKDWRWSSGGSPSGIDYVFLVHGTEFTMVWDGLTLAGANPVSVTVLDNDGQWRAPSALTGLSVTGPDTVASTSGTADRERWTFSPGGVHLIRFTPGQVGDNVNMNSIEFRPNFHNYRSKRPYGWEHYIPYQHCGRDVRNLTPFKHHQIPDADQYVHQTSWEEGSFTSSVMETQNPFFFYSPGGMMDIAVEGGVVHNQAVSRTWRIEIDGSRYGPFSVWSYQDAGVAQTSGIGFKGSIYLPPGWHWAILRLDSVTTGDELYKLKWSAKYVPLGPPNQLINRGSKLLLDTAQGIRERMY